MLAAFDEQVRRNPPADGPGERVEREESVVRFLEPGGGAVTWSRLTEATADALIAAQVERFAGLGAREWEWKHYSYDDPRDLPERLRAAGFVAEPAETLMIAEVAGLSLDVPPPAGVELRRVTDATGVAALVRVHDEVFGEDHAALGAALRAAVERGSAHVAAVVAMAGETPVAAGRVELPAGSDFASLWGGGTLPAWRGRGVFRALVAHRAALAAARGFRFVQVDASPESRPILRRLGFAELAITTPFLHRT